MNLTRYPFWTNFDHKSIKTFALVDNIQQKVSRVLISYSILKFLIEFQSNKSIEGEFHQILFNGKQSTVN